MSEYPTISVVINTLNRAVLLERSLQGLRQVRYSGDFEVVVINGPSTDETSEVLARAGSTIRVGEVDEANLSVSRNAGIALARGEIIAFLDDDAVPESAWLSELAKAYEDPGVGAAGGFVFNHTGYEYQYTYATVNRLGEADLSPEKPQPELCFPGSFTFPHLLGANSSFRRSALLEINGFDEEFNYYLDETDVQLRLVDAGYVIAQAPRAVVHHSYAPSSVRGHNKVARNRYSILKNKLYFSLVHAREYMSTDEVLAAHHRFVNSQRQDMTWALGEGLIDESDLEQFELDVETSTLTGLHRGFEGRRPPSVSLSELPEGPITPYPTVPAETLNIALVSQELPPESHGGVGTFVDDLAVELGQMGHEVHVISRTGSHSRVDFERGIWIHRLSTSEMESDEQGGVGLPPQIWSWSSAALREVERIHSARPVDIVEAPIWDAQGIAFLLDGRWPLVTSLQTTLKAWLSTRRHLAEDKAWMASFGLPVIAAERSLMLNSNAIRAISAAVRNDIETLYSISLPSQKVVVAHLGIADVTRRETDGTNVSAAAPRGCSFLFVGRVEPRKGVDTLLAAFETARQEMPGITLDLIGDFPVEWADGPVGLRTPDDFRLARQNTEGPVRFRGAVTDNQLNRAYQSADVLIAPSTYESFGLVFVEAMARGLPVIGTEVGGIPEVVEHAVNGFLVPVGDVDALAEAIITLARNPELRTAMGQAGRKRFEGNFTARLMAERSLPLYEQAIADHSVRA